MIPKLIDSVCNLVISGDEIIIITMLSVDIFKFGTILMKKLLKTSATAWSSWETIFFSMSVILDFVFILSAKNGFTVFQKVLLCVMSVVLILLKKLFFSVFFPLYEAVASPIYDPTMNFKLIALRSIMVEEDLHSKNASVTTKQTSHRS